MAAAGSHGVRVAARDFFHAVSSGETHFAICVATDVQGFTPIAEKLSLKALTI